MAPIDYSKWDDLDTDSEGENVAPATLRKNAIKPWPSPKRCRLLELPAELRNRIWGEALKLDEVIPFHRLKQPDLVNRFNKKIESPSPNLRLACKQIHSEVKDMVLRSTLIRSSFLIADLKMACSLPTSLPFGPRSVTSSCTPSFQASEPGSIVKTVSMMRLRLHIMP